MRQLLPHIGWISSICKDLHSQVVLSTTNWVFDRFSCGLFLQQTFYNNALAQKL